MDWVSGPRLDCRLSCCEIGRMESLLIHEPFEEEELRTSSGAGTVFTSPCFADAYRQFDEAFGGVICACEERRGMRVGFVVVSNWAERGGLKLSVTAAAESLVPGRDENALLFSSASAIA